MLIQNVALLSFQAHLRRRRRWSLPELSSSRVGLLSLRSSRTPRSSPCTTLSRRATPPGQLCRAAFLLHAASHRVFGLSFFHLNIPNLYSFDDSAVANLISTSIRSALDCPSTSRNYLANLLLLLPPPQVDFDSEFFIHRYQIENQASTNDPNPLFSHWVLFNFFVRSSLLSALKLFDELSL
ncbi:hypothetical protein HN51_004225 [Arachis hypogaea]